ncbi:MAG TPA: NUDIX domain-containing protein, partial [Acidobacteriota bacterium]
MNSKNEITHFFETGHKEYLHHLSIDCVIFGYHEHELKVLLLNWKNSRNWSLPGGFIKLNETLHNAAERILKERTGLDKIFLQQFHTFGDPHRSDRSDRDIIHLSNVTNTRIPKDHWLLKRTVTIGYYAITEYSKVNPQPDYFSDECAWHHISSIPTLVF